jgi:hypothetical protein
MDKLDRKLTEQEVAEARERRLIAQHLQALEGSPATPDQVAMFEMFERERWSHEKRIAFILTQAQPHLAHNNARSKGPSAEAR